VNSSNHKDYYEVLGLDGSASLQEIKDSYRKLAFQYHPDRNKDNPETTEKMKAINEAYAILSDPVKRNEYDSFKQRYGTAAFERYRQNHSQADMFRGSDIEQVFQEFSRSFGFRSADEVFREFYGPGFQSYEYRRPGFTFMSYVFNGAKTSEAGTQPPLPAIQRGLTGRVIKFILTKVFKIQIPERGRDINGTLRLSPETARLGGEESYRYKKSGKPRNLLVKIPPGIINGQIIRLKEMGVPGTAGGMPGDLLLKVKLKVTLFQRIRSLFGNRQP
jgi:DnaJ-class molecular chaperone